MNIKRLWIALFFLMTYGYANANNEDFTEINATTPSEGVGSTYISGFNFNNKQVTYDEKSGLAFFESDIVLGTIDEVELWKSQLDTPGFVGAIIITGDRYRWASNIVPYQFAANVSQEVKSLVGQAIVHWEQSTNIDFVLRNGNNAASFPDFINIVSDQYACWSYVGLRGGVQKLNLVQQCGFGAAVHEFGHVLGLWHEQSREDRDNYVQINWENIQTGKAHNFNQHVFDGDDVNAYDYDSIMHYGAYTFSKNNLPTITPLQNVNIGQRFGLSIADVTAIDELYPQALPVANLNKGSYSIYFGDHVLIDGRNSFDPDGSVLQFDWNLGDGTVITQGNSYINHLYDSKGAYDIALNVFDQDGNTGQATAVAVVYGIEAILPAINLLLLN